MAVLPVPYHPRPMEPDEGGRIDRKVLALAFLVCLLLAAVGLWRIDGLISDDAYVTYRYARNLAEGHGWAYNVGEVSSNAATSPAYVVLLAAMYKVYPNMHLAATLLFVLFAAGTGVWSYACFAKCRQPMTGSLAAVLVLLSPWLLSTRGMESFMFLFFAALCLFLFLDRRELLTGLGLGVLTLVRGDGLLLAVVLGVAWIAMHRKLPWRMAAGTVGTLIPWSLFSLAKFDSLLPGTLSAKIAQGRSGFWGTEWIFFRGVLDNMKLFGFVKWVIGIGLLAALGTIALLFTRSNRRLLIPVGAFATSFVALYGIAFDVPPYHWYYSVPVWGAIMFASAGAVWIFNGLKVQGISRVPGRWRRPLSIAVAIAVLGTIALGIRRTPSGYCCQHYVKAGEWLRENAAPDAVIAATEIGEIGWFADRPVVDYLGLLNERQVPALAKGDLTEWLEISPPDYWVVHIPAWSFETPGMSQPAFRKAFRKVFFAPGQVYGGEGIVIFQRVLTMDEARQQAEGDSALIGAISSQMASQGSPIDRLEEGEAIAELIRIYLVRPDLQRRFGPPNTLDLSALIEWGATIGSSEESTRRELAANANTLTQLSVRAGKVRIDVGEPAVIPPPELASG